ncbi:MAG TPA: dihydroorotase family protein, partial [Planctomycetota bacterium]|nr:dihydroorotase family protein [Planctomycetota bacterium]
MLLPQDGAERGADVLVEGHSIAAVAASGALRAAAGAELVEGRGRWLLPGFIDDHVHLREPGLEHKEGYESGTRAAAAGGITTLLEIQNNPPLMTSRDAVEVKLALVRPQAAVNVGVYGSLAGDEPGAIGAMADLVAGYKLFLCQSTGELEVRGEEKLAAIFAAVARTGRWLVVHAEDGPLVDAGLARWGDEGAAAFHLARPAAAEIEATRTALRLARQEGARLHVFHVST